jgi:hypothetical protein
MTNHKRLVLASLALVPLSLAACDPGPLPGEPSSTSGGLAVRDSFITPTSPVVVQPLPPLPPPPPPDPIAPSVLALEQGAGWRRVQVSGMAEDIQTGTMQPLSDEFYVINGRNSINYTSLPANTRQILSAKMMAAPMPEDGDEEIIVVPKRLNDAVQSGVAYFSICDDDNNKVLSKTYSFDKSYNYHRNTEPGAFVGSGDFNTQMKGTITGQVKYSIKYSWCIPTVVIHRVTVLGSADVLANASLVAQFQKKWSWDHEVAAPVLGTVSFFGIPVTFKAPITVGLDAAAAATLNLQGSYQAHGSFNVHCNGNGCDGSKNATSGFLPGGSPTASVSGMVKVTPWAEGAIRAYVLDEWLAYAQVGVRARLPGELWGYYGNTCGDGNHDGTAETVSAATLDLNVAIDVVAKAGFLGSDLGPWSWTVWEQHLAFWNLAGGSALDPIFYTETCGGGNLAIMRGRMRPCWPYQDAITYRVTWSDGAVTDFTGAPSTLFTQNHSFATYGSKPIRLDALHDAKGRELSRSVTTNVNLTWLPVACLKDQVLAQ